MEYKSRLEFYIEKLDNVNDAIRAAKAEQELALIEMKMNRTKEAEALYTTMIQSRRQK